MLTLPTKKKWFDMILSGDDTRYYESRFDKYMGKSVQVKFRNGYRKDSPSFIRMVIPRYGKGRLEWGAEQNKNYIVLEIQPPKEEK